MGTKVRGAGLACDGHLAGFVDEDEASDEEEQDELGTGTEHREQ